MGLAAAALVLFYGLWFVFPLLRARTHGRAELIVSPAS
jgi:hypothetical protein